MSVSNQRRKHRMRNASTIRKPNMKIANSVTYTTGRWQNEKMIIRPYKLTHEGARRILQREIAELWEGESCPVAVSVNRISTMLVSK